MSLTLTIGAVDQTSKVLSNSFTINDFLTQRVNTASFKLITDNSYIPENGQELIITIDGTRVFGGAITVRESRAINTTQIEYNIDAQDYTLLLMHKLAVETYAGQTCKYIIQDLITQYCPGYGITTTNAETGPVLDRIQFNYLTVLAAIKKICQYTGYDFYIDYNKDIHFFLAENNPAPFDITTAAKFWNFNLKRDLTQISNAIFVRGSTYLSETYTQNEKGNGIKTDYTLSYKPHSLTASVGGAAKTIGIDNIDDAALFDAIMNYNEKTIKFKVAPADGSAVIFTYTYDVPILVYYRDPVSIATLAALEGTDGIREKIIVDNTIKTQAEARQRAEGDALQNANPKYTARYTTITAGLRSGMIQNINLALFGINENLIITQVQIKIDGAGNHRYEVSLEGRLYGLTELLISLLDKSDQLSEREDEVLDKILVNYEKFYITDSSVITKNTPPFKYATARYGFSKYGDAHNHYHYGGTTYGSGKYA